MTKKKTTTGVLDWTGGHSPGWAAVNGAGLSALTAAVGYLADAPHGIGLAEGVAGAVAASAVAARRRYSPGHRAYRAAAWLLAGGWTSWAMAVGPWSGWLPAASLAAGATLAWGCGAAYEAYEQDAPRRQREAAEQAAREATGDDWEARLERVCRVAGCHVIGVEQWDTGMGYSVEVRLPEGGATVDAISQQVGALRADLRLPRGCSLEVDTGIDYGTVIIRVNTADALTELHPFPADLPPTSINDEFSIGKFRDGSDALAALRFHCGLVIGQPEGGKTNVLNVINARLLQCVDVLVWHIDTTGAGITLPWLRPWAREGTTDRPVIDWAASTVDEAGMMLTVAAEIIAARKRGYQDLMYSVNDDKVPVGTNLPEILIVADEVAQLPLHIQEGISTVINTGRASGVRFVNSALRGTRDMVTPAMREMTRLRIAMRVSDESEFSHIFSDARNLKKSDASVQGSGFMESGEDRPRPFKAFRLEPRDISRIAQEVTSRRPALDSISAAVPSGTFYAERWTRTLRHLYQPETPLAPAAEALRGASAAPLPSPGDGVAPGEAARPGDGHTGGLSDLRALLFPTSGSASAKETPAPPPAPAPAPQPDAETRQRFHQVLDDAMWHVTPPAAAADPAPAPAAPTLGPVTVPAITDPVQRQALDAIAAAGTAGLSPKAIGDQLAAAGQPRDRSTVHRWLGQWVAYGAVLRQEQDGRVTYVTNNRHAA